jgi:hypothetical protein
MHSGIHSLSTLWDQQCCACHSCQPFPRTTINRLLNISASSRRPTRVAQETARAGVNMPLFFDSLMGALESICLVEEQVFTFLNGRASVSFTLSEHLCSKWKCSGRSAIYSNGSRSRLMIETWIEDLQWVDLEAAQGCTRWSLSRRRQPCTNAKHHLPRRARVLQNVSRDIQAGLPRRGKQRNTLRGNVHWKRTLAVLQTHCLHFCPDTS